MRILEGWPLRQGKFKAGLLDSAQRAWGSHSRLLRRSPEGVLLGKLPGTSYILGLGSRRCGLYTWNSSPSGTAETQRGPRSSLELSANSRSLGLSQLTPTARHPEDPTPFCPQPWKTLHYRAPHSSHFSPGDFLSTSPLICRDQVPSSQGHPLPVTPVLTSRAGA